MACSHISDCPLFPCLKSSLSGWRRHYCDSDDAWVSCARYTRSVEGRPIPLALLPNGKMALAIGDAASGGSSRGGTPVALGGRPRSIVLTERPADAGGVVRAGGLTAWLRRWLGGGR